MLNGLKGGVLSLGLVVIISTMWLAGAATWTVCEDGCSHTSIQAAVDAALAGDTIEVQGEVYRESVNITKRLTVKGVDTGLGQPAVDAGGNGSAITLLADGIVLQGLIASNSSKQSEEDAGIKVASNNATIEGNVLTLNGNGILLLNTNNTSVMNNNAGLNVIGISLINSNKNLVSDNNAAFNFLGFRMQSSQDNTLRSNNLTGNVQGFEADGVNDIDTSNTVDGKPIYYLVGASGRVIDSSSNAGAVSCIDCDNVTIEGLNLTRAREGIFLRNTSRSIIQGNSVKNSSVGVMLQSSTNNTIKENTISNSTDHGIYLSTSDDNVVYRNTAEKGHVGITLENSGNNTIEDNNASGNDFIGIRLLSSWGNAVTNNIVRFNKDSGITLEEVEILNLLLGDLTYNNTISGNDASNNDAGISVWAGGNTIYGNNFANNGRFSVDLESGYNEWDNGTVGNHYSKITCLDEDENGICDSPYRIQGRNVDRYPMTSWYGP